MATSDALQLFGVTLVGATPENGRKLLLTLTLIVVALVFSAVARRLLVATGDNLRSDRVRFWLRQAAGLPVSSLSSWASFRSGSTPPGSPRRLGGLPQASPFALQRVNHEGD